MRVCRPQVKGHFAEENTEVGSSKPSARDQAFEPGALPWITLPGSILYFGTLLWDRPKNNLCTGQRKKKKKVFLINSDRLVYNPPGAYQQPHHRLPCHFSRTRGSSWAFAQTRCLPKSFAALTKFPDTHISGQ